MLKQNAPSEQKRVRMSTAAPQKPRKRRSENEPETPRGDVYEGEAYGMKRCDYCKSWFHPKQLENDLCRDCRPKYNQ